MNNTVLLQYHITSGATEVELEVLRHGNRKEKGKVPFYPTTKSTLEAIKKQLKDQPSQQVYKAVSGSVGGPSGAKTGRTTTISKADI